MILVCPNCDAKYVIPATSLGEEGREVRCAKCSHEWFEESNFIAPPKGEGDYVFVDKEEEEEAHFYHEEDELEEEEVEDSYFEPPALSEDKARIDLHEAIPDSVKPDNKKNNLPAFASEVVRQPASLQAKLNGYMAALTIFGLLIMSAAFLKQQVVSAWPPAAAIYELAGMPVTYKGEKLVMETLVAKILKDDQGHDLLTLQGRVINLTNEVQQVPKLLARLRSTNGEDGDTWTIDTPLEKLDPGESFTFKSEYPAVPRGVGSVNLTLLPTVML